MVTRRMSQASTAALLAAFTLVLVGCGREPYPTPSEAPPPPPEPVELMGEPVPPPPPEPHDQAAQAPVVIAMAPIPNPPEPARQRAAPRQQRAYDAPARPAPRYATPGNSVYTAPQATAPKAAAPAAPRATVPAPRSTAAASALKTVPAPAATKPGASPTTQAPATKVPLAKAPAPAAKTPVAKAPVAKTDESPLSDRSTRLAALEQSLAAAIGKTAKLKAPDNLPVNQPADVTLTIPAEFAKTLTEEATKNNLLDAVSTVNMNAVLSGEGFAIIPDTTQSKPLVDGQPTEFQWTVTAQPGQRGPLRADVGADLQGAGSDTLSLGQVQADSGFRFPGGARTLGYALLALIAALVVAFLARGRSGPSRSVSARRDARRARTGPHPMNLNESQT